MTEAVSNTILSETACNSILATLNLIAGRNQTIRSMCDHDEATAEEIDELIERNIRNLREARQYLKRAIR